jgi:hypothetical protein
VATHGLLPTAHGSGVAGGDVYVRRPRHLATGDVVTRGASSRTQMADEGIGSPPATLKGRAIYFKLQFNGSAGLAATPERPRCERTGTQPACLLEVSRSQDPYLVAPSGWNLETSFTLGKSSP